MENNLKRILVCSGINGRIISFINYIEMLFLTKKLFDYVFCIGDFFGDDKSSEKEWEEYKKSKMIVSVPVYILGPNKKQHEKYFQHLINKQLATNIYYLGKAGIFTIPDGLNVGYISGIQSDCNEKNELHTFNHNSLVQFKDFCTRTGVMSLDILLTSPWPLEIKKERFPDNQKTKSIKNKMTESQLLSWIANNFTPRYHFSGLQGVFYQRNPYKNNSTNTVTRFIGLGDFLDKKQKWLYGIVLSPLESTNQIKFPLTKSPYASDLHEENKVVTNTTPNQHLCNKSTNSDKKIKKSIIKNSIVHFDIEKESCWFCLSSKNIAKHMVIFIGNQIYLAGTKGPLVKEHIMIASINHYKSFAKLPIDAEKEINMLKSSLDAYFKSTGRVAVYYERNFLSAHFQLQVIPIPTTMIDYLEDAFKDTFKSYNLSLVYLPPTTSIYQIAKKYGENYFYIELPNKKRLFHNGVKQIDLKKKFPINIAREILASPTLLNVQDRIDWRKCEQNVDEEKFEIRMFQRAFEPYNLIKN